MLHNMDLWAMKYNVSMWMNKGKHTKLYCTSHFLWWEDNYFIRSPFIVASNHHGSPTYFTSRLYFVFPGILSGDICLCRDESRWHFVSLGMNPGGTLSISDESRWHFVPLGWIQVALCFSVMNPGCTLFLWDEFRWHFVSLGMNPGGTLFLWDESR